MSRRRLPVRQHPRPEPRNDPLAKVPPELLAKVPRFAAAVHSAPVFGRVDRARHSRGWGYDVAGSIALERAEALGWEGQA